MSGRKNGTASKDELVMLASKIGVTSDTDQGRAAFSAYLSTAPKEARRVLFTRVAARRAQASAAKAPTHRPINAAEAQALRTGESTRYPEAWAKGRSLGAASAVQGTGQKPVRSRTSPADVRHAPRITEGND